VPGVLGVLGRRRPAGGEHRHLKVLHVTVPPPKPNPDIGTHRLPGHPETFGYLGHRHPGSNLEHGPIPLPSWSTPPAPGEVLRIK
jgi:hypothetical protein